MQLRNGTNTISDERFDAAARRLVERQTTDPVVHAAARTGELPHEMAARHTREWIQLREERIHLSVQQWLRRHPDKEHAAELMGIPHRRIETKGWTHPSEVAHLDSGRPRALWERLATRENYQVGAAAAAKPVRESFWTNEISVGKALRQQQEPQTEQSAQKTHQQQR